MAPEIAMSNDLYCNQTFEKVRRMKAKERLVRKCCSCVFCTLKKMAN